MSGGAVQANWLDKLPPLRLGACLGSLAAVLLLAFVPIAALAHVRFGSGGVTAAAVALAICWAGSSLALVATFLFARDAVTAPLVLLVFGLLFNGALPFLVGLTLHKSGGPLAECGVFGLVVVFIQFALAAETLLALCLVKRRV